SQLKKERWSSSLAASSTCLLRMRKCMCCCLSRSLQSIPAMPEASAPSPIPHGFEPAETRMKLRSRHSEAQSADEASMHQPLSGARYQPQHGLSIPSVTILDERGRVIEEQQRSVFRHNVQQGFGADIIFG